MNAENSDYNHFKDIIRSRHLEIRKAIRNYLMTSLESPKSENEYNQIREEVNEATCKAMTAKNNAISKMETAKQVFVFEIEEVARHMIYFGKDRSISDYQESTNKFICECFSAYLEFVESTKNVHAKFIIEPNYKKAQNA